MTKRSPTSTYVIQVLVKSSTENAAQIVFRDSPEPRSAEPTRCSSGSISLRSRASRGTFGTPRIGTFDRFGPQITQNMGVNHKRDPVPIFPRFLLGFREPMWRSLYDVVRVFVLMDNLNPSALYFWSCLLPTVAEECTDTECRIQWSMASSSARYFASHEASDDLAITLRFPLDR
jgi:hypothetical protein